MEQQGQLAASSMIESLTGWWELAGVDAAVGEAPIDWLAVETRAEVRTEASKTPATVSLPVLTVTDQPAVEWPTDIDMLKSMIRNGAKLPGNRFGTDFISPSGPSSCEVMIISDLPDQDEVVGKMLGSGATGMLLGRMLAAIGINLTDCYWTALATTIPPTGDLPDEALPELVDFTLHQLGLLKPNSVILLGSTACKALLGEELMKARAQLRNLNHDGSNMAVLTTFHPRTLIARPAMKAQAWKDLQMFAKRADL
jgi:uracil-DNA glycosylase family 4